MKRIITKLVVLAGIILGASSMVEAAVIPTTAGVKLICEGGTYDLGDPVANTTWIVRFSETANDPTPSEGVTLAADGKTISIPKTGYYYIYSLGTAPGSCISEAQEIPVYVFKPLSVSIDAPTSYCVENASTTTFSADVTTTDTYTTYTYQWYTVTNGLETPIALATNATYVPTGVTPNQTVSYRVKVGYLVGTDKFCPAISIDKDITVTPLPAKPIIVVTNTGASW